MRTNIGSVEEFDLLVCIDSSWGVFSQEGVPIGYGVGTAYPNPKYNAEYLKPDGSGVSGQALVRWLHNVVYAAVVPYGVKAPVLNEQTVTVELENSEVVVELVPGGVFNSSTGRRFYNISSGYTDDWTLTAPREDVDELNATALSRANFRNVVRVAKAIVRNYGLPIPSFAIERALVAYAKRTTWSESFQIEVRWGLKDLADQLRGSFVADPFDQRRNLLSGNTGTSGTLLAKVAEVLDFATTMTSQIEARTLVLRTLRAE